MGIIDFIIIGTIALIVGSAIFYIYRSKKKGKKCIGCPDSGSCSLTSSGTCCNCGCAEDR